MSDYNSVRRNVIRHLHEIACVGQIEAGYLLDRLTGETLAYQEANPDNPDEISFEVDLGRASDVAVLHNHRNNLPPGADDWQNFLHLSALQEMTVVTRDNVYYIEKPASWSLPVEEAPERSFLRFQAMIERARRAAGWEQGFRYLSEAAQMALLSETNDQMARFYGVRLRHEEM